MQPRRPKHLHSNSILARGTHAMWSTERCQQLIRVRRYGNRKERLRKKQSESRRSKYEACLGNSEIIVPYSKYGTSFPSLRPPPWYGFGPRSAPPHGPVPLYSRAIILCTAIGKTTGGRILSFALPRVWQTRQQTGPSIPRVFCLIVTVPS